MDLYSMVKRENFFELFFPTVKKYFKEVLHEDIEIAFAANKEECNCVIKPKLSVVTSIHPTSRAKEFFYSEWNIRNSRIKNLLIKLYIWLMTNSGRVFAEYKIAFKPGSTFSDDYVIAPNNRTIRIFDYQKNIVGCICKDGFTDKYMKNQIKFRSLHDYEFILKMNDYGERWFVEPVMKGHPLARVADDNLYEKGITKTIENIRRIAKDSLQQTELYAYYDSLADKIERYLQLAIEKKGIKTVDNVNKLIKSAYDLVHSEPDTHIFLSDSHGDLQTGNIWLDENNKIWIYDWETAGTRSVWYDPLVLKFSLRRANGWAEFLQNFTEGDLREYLDSISAAPVSPAIIKGIVMLEDIIFYFEDMLELPQTWGNNIFDEFILRLSNAVSST